MKTPFQIIARPVTYLTRCEARKAEEARGLIGFHNSDKCPDCKKEKAGWELWGENGHLQGSTQDVSPEAIARLTLAYSRRSPAQITVSEFGYTYLRA